MSVVVDRDPFLSRIFIGEVKNNLTFFLVLFLVFFFAPSDSGTIKRGKHKKNDPNKAKARKEGFMPKSYLGKPNRQAQGERSRTLWHSNLSMHKLRS